MRLAWFEQARAQQPDNSASAADLCILMEILADQPSPDSAKARRMELQVQRLADGLGKGLDARQEMQQLLQRWLQVNADLQQQERFIQALEKLASERWLCGPCRLAGPYRAGLGGNGSCVTDQRCAGCFQPCRLSPDGLIG